MKQIICISGFGSKPGDDRAGFATLAQRIRAQEEPNGATVHEQLWNDEIYRYTADHNNGPFILVGRSWGAAAIYHYADTHPEVTIDLAVTFDPIPNPMWWQFGRWKKRKNINRVVSFLQHENILLRGRRIHEHNDTEVYLPEYKVDLRYGTWFDEYLMPNDRTVLNSLGHIMISKNEWVVTKALKEIEQVHE